MNSRSKLVNLGLIVILSTALLSCRNFYKHSYNDHKKQASIENSAQEQWVKEEQENHLVIHVGQEMHEISNLSYNETSDSIVADFSSFQGQPLKGYFKVLGKRVPRSFRRRGMKLEDVHQIHLFINEYHIVNDSQIAFSVSDIYQVDTTKEAKVLNVFVDFGLGTLLGAAPWIVYFMSELLL